MEGDWNTGREGRKRSDGEESGEMKRGGREGEEAESSWGRKWNYACTFFFASSHLWLSYDSFLL